MTKSKMYIVGLWILSISVSCIATVWDNRYIPLIEYPFITVPGRFSEVAIDAFFATGHRAFGSGDTELNIPELHGLYDQSQVQQALVSIGKPYRMDPITTLSSVKWKMQGKIQAQGLTFFYRQHIFTHYNNHCEVGFDFPFMHVNSRIHFVLNGSSFPESTRTFLQQALLLMDQDLGLVSDNAREIGIGDIDGYVRFNKTWDFLLKFRRIDLAARAGILFPTGKKANINKPASIPFGGNGHWGVYAGVDAEFEVREDWKAGIMIRLIDRIAKKQCLRLASVNEPDIYGVIVGTFHNSPGVTGVVSPYVSMENLRDGFGARAQFSFIMHQEDYISGPCGTLSTVPVNIEAYERHSRWTSEYVTLTGFYDFGKLEVDRTYKPIVRFSWDIPVSVFSGHHVSKTNLLSLGIEYNF